MTTTHTSSPYPDIEQARIESLELVKKRAYVSAGAAVVPIPFFDVVVDVGVLSVLLPQINEKFGLTNEQTSIYDPVTKKVDWTAARKRAVELSGFVATRAVAKQSINGFLTKMVGKQVSKFVPFGGSLVAGTLGYFLMKKLAEEHVKECYDIAIKLRQGEPVDVSKVDPEPKDVN